MITPEKLSTIPPPRNGRAWELSNGELIPVGNAGTKHERTKRRILKALFEYEQRCQTGEVYAESQFTLGNHTARIPDAAFVLNAKLALLPDTDESIPFAPDLAIEVISDSEPAADAERKVAEYLAGGTTEVWQVYPKAQGPPGAAPNSGETHPSSRDSAAMTCACLSKARRSPVATPTDEELLPLSPPATEKRACSSNDLMVRVRTNLGIRDVTAKDTLQTPLLPGLEVRVATFFGA